MALITYEGFENYSSLADVRAYLGFAYYQTPSIISTSDGVIAPRNNLSCLKMVSSRSYGTGTEINTARDFYPKFALSSPTNATYTTGVVGFAFYPRLPSGGGWGPFTPFAAIVGADNKPHFYLCLNANYQIEIRRWNTAATMSTRNAVSAANYVWSQDHVSFGYNEGQYCNEGRTGWDHHVTAPYTYSCNGINATWPSAALSSTKFEQVGTASNSSGNLVVPNQWNYIEIKFVLENTTANAGSVQIKINRNSTDATLDLNLTGVRNSTQATNTYQKLMFGIVWGHNSAGTQGAANLAWTTYIDDIYWLDQSGATFNNFLGRVSCQKINYTTTTNNTAFSGSLASIQDPFSGSASYSLPAGTGGAVSFNANNQDVSFSASAAAIAFTPLVVQQFVYGHKEGGNNVLRCRANYLGAVSASTDLTLTTDATNGGVKFVTYERAPDGAAWTAEKLKNTQFSHTVVAT
ncbi:MAG: hypothetical protein EBU08_04070 [Micrococcales bacterium]|nr:hypothetical protein [Micrococcales bacterium]